MRTQDGKLLYHWAQSWSCKDLHLSVNHSSQRDVEHSPGQNHLASLLLSPHPQGFIYHTGHPLPRWSRHRVSDCQRQKQQPHKRITVPQHPAFLKGMFGPNT